MLRDIEDASLAKARASFESATRDGGVKIGWASVVVEATRAFAREGRCADLLVLGQRDPESREAAFVPPDFVESILIESGRPALIVTYVGAPEAIGRVALVAWKSSRESARAVSAALPLLRHCERLHVATWTEDDDDEDNGPLNNEGFLRSHGLVPTMHGSGGTPGDIGDALLSLAADLSADLLVMDCYGHARAREWALGGATRSVLGSMTLPVLMSH
ncbi:MAG: universal stress protein [Caldimonas sp.]